LKRKKKWEVEERIGIIRRGRRKGQGKGKKGLEGRGGMEERKGEMRGGEKGENCILSIKLYSVQND
jgi:hypothetical protein